MLVIAVDTASGRLSWVGRRHDDNGPESTGEQSAQGLFDAVFHALHDGEQVAIGFDIPLTAPADDKVPPRDDAVLGELRRLVDELGAWRPWTVVTTSLPRWRATTSVLVWEAVGAADPGAAVEAFFASLHAEPARTEDDAGVRNLAAAIAVASQVTADPAELTGPVLQVRVDPQVTDAAR